jgi:cytoskeletal protein RodZ
MTRPMKKLEIVELARREVKAVLKLSPWLLASLLLAAVLWSTDLAATSGLFQSPPEATPTTEPSTPVVTPTLTLTPTLGPTEAPPPTVEPTVTAEPALPPAETEVPAIPTEVPPTTAPTASPIDEGAEPEPTEDEVQHYADENADLTFEWGMLFDSVALGASAVWLCCGVLVVLGIPVFFFALWVVGKRRRQDEE